MSDYLRRVRQGVVNLHTLRIPPEAFSLHLHTETAQAIAKQAGLPALLEGDKVTFAGIPVVLDETMLPPLDDIEGEMRLRAEVIL